MKEIIKDFRNKQNNEDGAAELINALIIIPIILVLLFSIFNVGSYFLSMSEVTNSTQNAARLTAIYGGENSEIALVKKGTNVEQYLKDQLMSSDGNCKLSACTEPPVVNCTKKNGIQPGDEVSCSVTYSYRSIIHGMDFTGLSDMLEKPRTITQKSVSETWGY